MPERLYHLEFDDILRSKEVISRNTDGNTVHNIMDEGLYIYGSNHRSLDKNHSVKEIRKRITTWINNLGTIKQRTATDYIRIAYGHLCLDYMASKLQKQNMPNLNWTYIYKRTWKYFRYCGFYRSYYKGI
jgi:hypothetical protein